MSRNLEIKASVPSLRFALAVSKRIRARRAGMLRQTDTYFNVTKGRLKLREVNGREFELIYYERFNRKGSRFSDYFIVPLQEPAVMRHMCSSLFGVKATVRKHRILFLYKNARIHLDRVKGLGSFIEFEVIVRKGKVQARQLMDFLVLEFGIARKSCIAGSYVDLLSNR